MAGRHDFRTRSGHEKWVFGVETLYFKGFGGENTKSCI
jgi:hypothetical protein